MNHFPDMHGMMQDIPEVIDPLTSYYAGDYPLTCC